MGVFFCFAFVGARLLVSRFGHWALDFPVHHSLGACCPNQFPLRMWGRHSCLPVLGTFQSPDSASNCQLWSAKLENFATGRLERPPYNLGNTPLTLFLVGKSGPGAPGDWKVARTRIGRASCRERV